MTDIFFSYSSADRERVRPIRDALVAQGFEVFWDQQVPAGMDWDTWIRQHLTKSKCVMAFWSATSVSSDNVRHEAAVAKQYTNHTYKNEKAREYALHGFSRRISTLNRCAHNIFDIIPPEVAEVPARQRLYDAQINLQAYVANVYGCIDNLAWIWVYDRGLEQTLQRNRVGFRKHHTETRSTLTNQMQEYLKELDPWIEYVIDYRDALAHRIPLYIPPGAITADKVEKHNELQAQANEALAQMDVRTYEQLMQEQNRLFEFRPMMTHSVSEAKGFVWFHGQLINDFLTIEELGKRMFTDLGGLSGKFSRPRVSENRPRQIRDFGISNRQIASARASATGGVAIVEYHTRNDAGPSGGATGSWSKCWRVRSAALAYFQVSSE